MLQKQRPRLRKLEEVLTMDDASRHLEGMPSEERWQDLLDHGLNGLPKEGSPPTVEERGALRAIWSSENED